MLLNLSLPTWPVLFVNEAWEKATGLAKDDSSGLGFWEVFQASSTSLFENLEWMHDCCWLVGWLAPGGPNRQLPAAGCRAPLAVVGWAGGVLGWLGTAGDGWARCSEAACLVGRRLADPSRGWGSLATAGRPVGVGAHVRGAHTCSALLMRTCPCSQAPPPARPSAPRPPHALSWPPHLPPPRRGLPWPGLPVSASLHIWMNAPSCPPSPCLLQTTDADSSDACRRRYAAAVDAQQSFDLTVVLADTPPGAASTSAPHCAAPGQGRRFIRLQFRCAHNQTVDSFMPLVGIPSILSSTSPHAAHVGPVYYFATVVQVRRRRAARARARARVRAWSCEGSQPHPLDRVALHCTHALLCWQMGWRCSGRGVPVHAIAFRNPGNIGTRGTRTTARRSSARPPARLPLPVTPPGRPRRRHPGGHPTYPPAPSSGTRSAFSIPRWVCGTVRYSAVCAVRHSTRQHSTPAPSAFAWHFLPHVCMLPWLGPVNPVRGP